MSKQPPRRYPHETRQLRERVLRHPRKPHGISPTKALPAWIGTAAMEANGPWDGGRLSVRRRACAEVTFTPVQGNKTCTLFDATGTVTYSASGVGVDCILELQPTALPIIGSLQYISAFPSPLYCVAGGAVGLLEHRLSCHSKPLMVMSTEAWPWLVVPFQVAPADADTLAGTLTVGDATYTWSLVRSSR